MRWPWTRRPAEPAVARSGARTASSPPAAPPSPMGWAFLPPIQRTLSTPIAPVTRPAEVPAELSAWRSPAFTDSLSHAVVDTAPGGRVDGDGAGSATRRHLRARTRADAAAPATADRRAAVGPPRAGRPGPAPRPSTADRVGGRTLHSFAHPGAVGRHAARPPRRRRRPDPLNRSAGPSAAGACVSRAAVELPRRSRRPPTAPGPDARARRPTAGRSVRAAAGRAVATSPAPPAVGGRAGACNAAWTRRWRRPTHPAVGDSGRRRTSSAPLGLGAPLAIPPR